MLSNILITQIFYKIILALIFTILLEYFIIVRILKIPIKLFIFTNILTNVTANIIIIIYDLIVSTYNIVSYRMLVLLILECFVFVVETVIFLSYYKYKNVVKVLAYTFLANLISAYVGSIILRKIL